MKTQRFVLDTSAFTSGVEGKEKIEKRIIRMIKLISQAKKADITCYCANSTWLELKGLLENKGIPAKEIKTLDIWVVQKQPSTDELTIPASFLYEYVGEVRERFNRGLREAEKAVASKSGNRPDAEVIRDLRDNFKRSMRQGILDSTTDLDSLLLAKELNAGIVASDEGIKKWARHWGIRLVDNGIFCDLLEEHIKKSKVKK